MANVSCASDFLEAIDSSVYRGEFPTWDFDPDHIFVGCMRVSGFTGKRGVALVFEHVEYAVNESVFQSVAHCLATFPVKPHLVVGDAIHIDYQEVAHPETGELSFGACAATSREKTFKIRLDKSELIRDGYLERGAERPTIPAVLFKVCDAVPRDWLYSEPAFLIEAFSMGADASRLFSTEEWEHLSLQDVYEEEIKPSTAQDIVALVKAVCDGNAAPTLKGTANTSWRKQWRGET